MTYDYIASCRVGWPYIVHKLVHNGILKYSECNMEKPEIKINDIVPYFIFFKETYRKNFEMILCGSLSKLYRIC